MFADRRHAGQMLADELGQLNPDDPLIYALPRGGVPVGFEVAAALGAPLDVLVVRKIGVPAQPELAMGAIGEGGVVVRNDAVIRMARVNEDAFQRVLMAERAELDRRISAYRDVVVALKPQGRLCVIVDDGLATGATARAGIEVLAARGASAVWLAVPVAPRETVTDLAVVADHVVVTQIPPHFGAVGSWYRDFNQTTDEEVKNLLAESRLR